MDALLVATDILMRVSNPKVKLRMFLLTGGHSYARADDLRELCAKFVEHSIGFNLIGADFFDNGGDADAVDVRQGNMRPCLLLVAGLRGVPLPCQ